MARKTSYIFNFNSKRNHINLVLSIVTLLYVCYSVNLLSNSILQSSKLDRYKFHSLIDQGKIRSDVVIFGSSRALVHYSCSSIINSSDSIESCHNLGQNATSVLGQLPYIKWFNSKNNSADTAIINIDAALLNGSKDSFDLFEDFQYTPFLEDTDFKNDLSMIDGDISKYKYIPLYALSTNKELLYDSVKSFLGIDGKAARDKYGYRPTDREWDGKFETFLAKNKDGVDYTFNKDSVLALESAIDILSSESNVILVYSPELSDFSDIYNNKEEFLSIIKSIADEKKVGFLDYSEYEPLSNNRDFFYNSQHLNFKGAEVFSKELTSELK